MQAHRPFTASVSGNRSKGGDADRASKAREPHQAQIAIIHLGLPAPSPRSVHAH